MEQDIILIARAADYAARVHHQHRRKDAVATPYINHLTEVACLLAEAGSDSHLVCAGYLHDTIEDVNVTYEMLRGEFNPDIADLVRAVSDDKSLSKVDRKRLQVEHAPHSSPRVVSLKMADKISNLGSLALSPPVAWDLQRVQLYIEWAHQVVTRLPNPHPLLWERYQVARQRAMALRF